MGGPSRVLTEQIMPVSWFIEGVVMKHKMSVRLASHRWDWQRFAIVNRPGFTFIGTVQRGLQVGALARDEKGTYYQVNGDNLQALNEHQVTQAIVRARQRQSEAQQRPRFGDRGDRGDQSRAPRVSFTARTGISRN